MKNGMETQPIVGRMQAKVIRVLADTEVKQKLLVHGLEVDGGVAACSGKFINEERRSGVE
jgi:hypothetical protein